MNKQFVPYEQSLELKELGFDEPCLRVGNTNGHTMWKWFEVDEDTEAVGVNDVIQVKYGEEWVEIPTFSQSFNFFETQYQIFVEKEIITTPNEILDVAYRIKSWKFAPITIEFQNPYDCFDKTKSELECLRKMIKIIKELKEIK